MRKLHLANGVWQYKVGKAYVLIREPSRRSHHILCTAVACISPTKFMEGRFKGNADGMIKPRHVKAYIENYLLVDKT